MAIPKSSGGPMSALAPDLSAVGSAARASKGASKAPPDLTSFSVKKGDNGGIIVSEVYEPKAPAGRRPASFLLGGSDIKENPFSANDGAAATSHITDLLGQMGVTAAEPPAPPAPDAGLGGDAGLPPMPPPRAAKVTGPRGGSVAALGGPPPPPMGGGGPAY